MSESLEGPKYTKDIFYKLEEENIYKTFFHNSPDIIILVDEHFVYHEIHIPKVPRANLDSLIGKDLITTTPEAFRPKMLDALKRVFGSKETVIYETDGFSMGSYKYYLNHMSPICDKNNNVKYAYFVSRDITQQKENEKSISQLQSKLYALFQSMQQLYVIFDKNKNIIWYNEVANSFLELLGDKGFVISKNASEIFQADHYSEFSIHFNNVLKGEKVKFKKEFLLSDNHSRFIEFNFHPILENNELMAVATVGIDVTELVQKEENRKKINRELLLQNQQLNQYSHIISHNLRSPISTLMGIVNVIESFKDDKELVDTMLGQIRGTAQKLDTIIQDLNLILNQTTQEENVKQMVDLSEIVDSIQELNGYKSKRSITITTDFKAAPEIYAIKGYVNSILYNLISNSVKYKKPKEKAIINITSGIEEEGMVSISVVDNGLGIDLEKYGDKIFGFYKRFHNHTEGKGVGLHITKSQVEIMGGKIYVESKINEGALFKIYLPIN